jgi:hypothetical protein
MEKFGGAWTAKKLEVFEKYLIAYRQIFKMNEAASFFKTLYIDGFAGSGIWKPSVSPECGVPSLFCSHRSKIPPRRSKDSSLLAGVMIPE